MNIKIKLISALCFLSLIVNGQSVAFLGIAPDARSVAMGGVGVATFPDAWSIYWNGAKSVFSEKRGGVAFNYTPETNNMINGSRLRNLGFYYKLDAKSAVTVGGRYFSGGEFALGTEKINPKDYAFEAGYARILTKGLSAGVTVRYINSNLDMQGTDVADAVAFDLGLFYRMYTGSSDNQSVWSIGANFSNFGTKLSYGGEDYELPTQLKVGTSYKMSLFRNHELAGAVDAGYRISPSDDKESEMAAGLEYMCYNVAALRVGYHWGDPDKGGSSYMTLGCGLKYCHFYADFAYLLSDKDSDALNKTMRFTVGLDFGLFKSKK